MRRMITDSVLVIAVFAFPWWLSMCAAAAALFFFDSFYEIIFLGIIIDSLYNAPIAPFHHFQFVVTLLCIFIFVGIEALKRRLRFS